jgi:glycine cleavage system H protein
MTSTYYTEDHEWLRVEGDIATVGITQFAVEQLGDLVFVELPNIGRVVATSDAAVVVESVKAASDVYAPASGEVIAVNDAVVANPALVNSAPESDGWLWKMKLSDMTQLDGLMDADTYKARLGEEHS